MKKSIRNYKNPFQLSCPDDNDAAELEIPAANVCSKMATDSFTHTVSHRKGGADTAIISIVVQAVLSTVDAIYSISRFRLYGSGVPKST